MSIITRQLQDKNKINVAGPTGGGGIILQPQETVPQQQECPKCDTGGGNCVPDNYVPQWVARDTSIYPPGPPYFAGQSIAFDGNTYIGTETPVYAGLFDLSKSTADRAEICCNDVVWSVVVDILSGGPGWFDYVIIGGVIVISSAGMEIGQMRMTATPIVCGVEQPALVYDWQNVF